MASCSLKQMAKMAEEQELTVNPSPLELHGDSVIFDMSAKLPVKMLKKNKVYTLKTWYEFGDPTEQLEQFKFTDTEFPNQKVEQPSLSKRFSFPYKEGMETGTLQIQGIASNVAKTKVQETPVYPTASGLIMTSRLFQAAPSAIYADHGYNNKEELEPHNVEFLFDQGSSVLRRSEAKGAQGQLLTAFIASKIKTKTVTIIGSHSPEGTESTNSKLAEQRATVIREFYQRKMREYDYKGLADSIKFETKAIFQDWVALKNALKSYDGISDDQKSAILSIVNDSGNFEVKAKQISKLSFYNKLLKEVYPSLRTSTTEILSVKPKKTDAEINVLAKGISEGTIPADSLSYEELMYAATLTPLLEEKQKIYEAATKSNDSWKSHNNLGAVYVQMAQKSSNADTKKEYLEKAKAQFGLASNKEENSITFGNLASVELSLGNIPAAEAALKTAQNSGGSSEAYKSIAYTKGVIAIRKGDYSTAIGSLSSASDLPNAKYNLGLAQLLKKDYSKAATTLEEATYADDKNALAYYLRAIVAARTANETALGVTLTKATSLNTALKAKALTDLEFASFVSNPVFLDALK